MKRKRLFVVVFLAASVASGATASEDLFARIAQLDAQIVESESRARDAHDRLAASQDSGSQRGPGADVIRRAAEPIRAQVSADLGAWLGAFRKTVRPDGGNPVAGRDTANLLRLSSRQALRPRLKDVDVLRRADEAGETLLALSLEKAGLAFGHAWALGEAEAARAELERTVSSAGDLAGVAGDLDGAARDLQELLRTTTSRLPERDFHRQKGTLRRPVDAEPVSPFGSAGGTFVRPEGLTYRVEAGSPVMAVAPGVVTWVGVQPGYGHVVVVDHGGAYRTVYAHLGGSGVRVGQEIARGGEVGKSGTSGSLDGPRLYFELWDGSSAVDPQPWFLQN